MLGFGHKGGTILHRVLRVLREEARERFRLGFEEQGRIVYQGLVFSLVSCDCLLALHSQGSKVVIAKEDSRRIEEAQASHTNV